MTAQIGELKTSYYQRDWESALPNLSEGNWKTASHVAGLALPFVGILYKPAGLAISYTSSSLNFFSSGIEAYNASQNDPTIITSDLDRKKADTALNTHIWSVVKNGAEFVGTIASLRIGLVVHSVMNLGENLYALRGIKDMTWSQTGEKMLPVASNALYLLTLVSFSTPVAYGVLGASLVFQAGWSLYKARSTYKETKSWTDIKMLDTAAHTAMSVIYATKAKTALQQSWKIYTAVQRTFVLMRPASKHSKTDPNGGLSEKGKILAQTKMPVALEQIAKEKKKTSLVFFTSSAAHHTETAKIIAEQQKNATITEIEALHAKKKPEISMQDLVKVDTPPTPHVSTRKLPLAERWAILEKRWIESGQAAQGVESPAQVAARIDGGIREILDQQPDGSVLPVIVFDGTNITYYIENEILKNPNIPEKAARNLQDGGMRVVTMNPDEMGDLHVTEVLVVDPKKVELQA